jgi:hypothetical protein
MTVYFMEARMTEAGAPASRRHVTKRSRGSPHTIAATSHFSIMVRRRSGGVFLHAGGTPAPMAFVFTLAGFHFFGTLRKWFRKVGI